jgi:hypothetical protein
MPQLVLAQLVLAERVDTPTAVALTDLDTSARGIEAHSLLGLRTAVKSRSGEARALVFNR